MNPPWDDLQIHGIHTPTVFPVGPANVYVYTGSPVTLFDAGTNTEEAWEAFLAGLKRIGVRLEDIEQVILTHHHLDHIGLLGRIQSATKARVLAHVQVPAQIPFIFDLEATRQHLERLLQELGVPGEMAEAVVEGRMRYQWLWSEFTIDEVFGDQAEIGPFTAHFRPGHSSTDTVFTHREHGWAITGDHLIHRVTPNPLLRRCPEQGEREKSLVQYYDSLMATRALEVNWCFAGHGEPFHNHREAIDSTLQHIERRSHRILKALPREGATPYEMTRILFPRLNDTMFYYCLSAVTGHLEFLEKEGSAVHTLRDAVLHYHAMDSDA